MHDCPNLKCVKILMLCILFVRGDNIRKLNVHASNLTYFARRFQREIHKNKHCILINSCSPISTIPYHSREIDSHIRIQCLLPHKSGKTMYIKLQCSTFKPSAGQVKQHFCQLQCSIFQPKTKQNNA